MLPILFSVTGAIDNKSEKHEYHSISDNEDDDFFKPLDLGPSLMDEVFSELGSPNRLVYQIISSQLIFARISRPYSLKLCLDKSYIWVEKTSWLIRAC